MAEGHLLKELLDILNPKWCLKLWLVWNLVVSTAVKCLGNFFFVSKWLDPQEQTSDTDLSIFTKRLLHWACPHDTLPIHNCTGFELCILHIPFQLFIFFPLIFKSVFPCKIQVWFLNIGWTPDSAGCHMTRRLCHCTAATCLFPKTGNQRVLSIR